MTIENPGLQAAYQQLQDSYYNETFRNHENHFRHNPISHELRQLHAIEQGDIEDLMTVLDEDFASNEGRVADNPLRQRINIGIVCVTIASRTAINAGVHYEKAFTLSDVCIRLMEECKSTSQVAELYKAVQIHYAEMVRDILRNTGRSLGTASDSAKTEETNPHIEHCKDYIFSHLHGKISVSEIADYCGLNANYLSTLFAAHEHVTIKQYILNEKINLVQKMLTYSPYSYVEIAAYLGFASQSHMGTEFKRVTGMTPRAYRNKYQKDDFFAD